MAINEYMSPNINQHLDTHVDTYVPIDFNYLNGKLAQKQQEYDTGELMSETILNNIKANPLIEPHAIEARQRKQYYNDRTNQILEEAGGNYATAIPKLQQLGRELQEDLTQGTLAKINNTTANYLAQKENIKKIGERTGINQDDALKHLDQQTYGIYGRDPNLYKNTLSTYQHGERLKINDILDKAIGNLKSDGYSKVDLSDPNYLKKIGDEYLTNKKVHDSLFNTLASQPGIRYEAMLSVGANNPDEVTDQQLSTFIDNKILGPTRGAVFNKHEESITESAEGSARGKQKVENENNNAGYINNYNVPNITGKNATEVRDNYLKRNENLRGNVVINASNLGIPLDSKINTPSGKFNLNDALNPSSPNHKAVLDAIENNSFSIDGYSPSLLQKFRSNLLPTLTTNKAVTERFDNAVNSYVENTYQPGMKLFEETSGRAFNTQRGKKTLELDKETYAKLAKSQQTGEKFGNTYMDGDVPVINGKRYESNYIPPNAELNATKNYNTKSLFGIGKIYNDTNNINESIDNQLDIEGADTKNVAFSPSLGSLPTVQGEKQTQDMFRVLGNTIEFNGKGNTLRYIDPTDPYTNKEISQDEAIRNALSAKGVDQNVKSIEPVKYKEGGVNFANAPVGNKFLAEQKFEVTLEDGTKEIVKLPLNVEQLVSTAGLTIPQQEAWKLQVAQYKLQGNGNTQVPLLDENNNRIATLNAGGKTVTYMGKDGLITTDLEDFLNTDVGKKSLLYTAR